MRKAAVNLLMRIADSLVSGTCRVTFALPLQRKNTSHEVERSREKISMTTCSDMHGTRRADPAE